VVPVNGDWRRNDQNLRTLGRPHQVEERKAVFAEDPLVVAVDTGQHERVASIKRDTLAVGRRSRTAGALD